MPIASLIGRAALMEVRVEGLDRKILLEAITNLDSEEP
jgi:hypothetical protein